MIANPKNIDVGTKLILVRNPTSMWPEGKVITITNIDGRDIYYGPSPSQYFAMSAIDDFDIVEDTQIDTYFVVSMVVGVNGIYNKKELRTLLTKYHDKISTFSVIKNPEFVTNIKASTYVTVEIEGESV